jgi:hypothetical protein
MSVHTRMSRRAFDTKIGLASVAGLAGLELAGFSVGAAGVSGGAMVGVPVGIRGISPGAAGMSMADDGRFAGVGETSMGTTSGGEVLAD